MLFLQKVFQEIGQDGDLISNFLRENASFLDGHIQGLCESEYENHGNGQYT